MSFRISYTCLLNEMQIFMQIYYYYYNYKQILVQCHVLQCHYYFLITVYTIILCIILLYYCECDNKSAIIISSLALCSVALAQCTYLSEIVHEIEHGSPSSPSLKVDWRQTLYRYQISFLGE